MNFICLYLHPCFTTKADYFMIKTNFFLVNPVMEFCPIWTAFLLYFFIGNRAILLNQDGFLHIIN
jgi:hypothetical protein